MKNAKILFSYLSAAHRTCAASIFGLLMTLSLVAVSANAQTPPVEAPTVTTTTNAIEKAANQISKGKSVVRGRAVYDDSNRPVRRARVMLLDMTNRGPERTGKTNRRGEFQIKDVPAGSYFVMVDAAGIMTPLSLIDLEDKRPEHINLDEVRKHFDEVVVDGTKDVNVKVRARRGGAISGKVTYADGDPAINVRVTFLRKKAGGMVRFITNLNPLAIFGIQTDDRGVYRIAGLPPGEYIVSASEMIDHTDEVSDNDQQMAMAMGMFGTNSLVSTFYQGVTKASSASAVQVDAGQEQNEINIALLDREMHRLSGTVVARRDDSPLRGARIGVSSKDAPNSFGPFVEMGPNVTSDEQGAFAFSEMPDGVYTLTIEPPYASDDIMIEGDAEQPDAPSRATGPKHKFARKLQEVTIAGNDITDLTIKLGEGASVSGIVAVEGGRPLPQETTISLDSVNGESVPDGRQRVQTDGEFTITGVPSGAFYPTLYFPGDEFYVKSVTIGGGDLICSPLIVAEDGNVSSVRITLADAAALSGRVRTQNNAPVSDAHFVLVPADPNKWRSACRSYLFVTSADNGSYSTSGAPGQYLIIFVRAGDDPRAVNEAWIRDRAGSAQRVTLTVGQPITMDLIAPAQ